MDEDIDNLNHVLYNSGRKTYIRGGDYGKQVSDIATDILSFAADRNPITGTLFKPLLNIANAFADSQSNLLPSIRAKQQGIDLFHDDQFISQDDPTIKAQGITEVDQ